MLTCLELKTASQKSRISEMEGSLNMAHENSAKIRKQAMVYQEKIASLNKEVKTVLTLVRPADTSFKITLRETSINDVKHI